MLIDNDLRMSYEEELRKIQREITFYTQENILDLEELNTLFDIAYYYYYMLTQ